MYTPNDIFISNNVLQSDMRLFATMFGPYFYAYAISENTSIEKSADADCLFSCQICAPTQLHMMADTAYVYWDAYCTVQLLSWELKIYSNWLLHNVISNHGKSVFVCTCNLKIP